MRHHPQRPHGSVLIFAIVILAILAMLGTAFLLVVRQSGTASVSVLSNQQADIAARSGIENALRVLRSNVLRYTINTDLAVFDPNPNYAVMPTTNLDAINNTAPTVSPLVQFRSFDEITPRALLANTDYSGGFTKFGGPHFTSEMFGAVQLPMGTTIPSGVVANVSAQWVTPGLMFHIYPGIRLLIDTDTNAEHVTVLDVSETQFQAVFTLNHAPGIEVKVLEYARQNIVAGSIGDVYLPSPNANIKEMGRLNTTSPRGEYYVWIADLDSRLYVLPQDWGVDTTNTGYSSSAAIESGVLTYLNAILANGFDSGDLTQLVGTIPKNVTNDARFPYFRNNSEVANTLPSFNTDSSGPTYEKSRNLLDCYFTCYRDNAEFNLPLNLKFCKDSSAAININTAPVEVITAALSQIPSEDRHSIASPPNTVALSQNIPVTGGPSMADYLARRIVAKRPFLCRMDFEDFLASQIMGTLSPPTSTTWGAGNGTWDNSTSDDTVNPYIANTITNNGQVIPGDSDPFWQDPTQTYDPLPICYFMYFSIGRRMGPGNTTFSTVPVVGDPTYPTYQWYQTNTPNFFTTPELTLSQYLEIPGVPDNPPPSKFNLYGSTPPITPNMPTFQKARFRYFFGTALERDRIVNSERSLITAKEFNNIINSVTSIYVNDDKQVAFPGDLLSPGATVVTMGTDGLGHPKMNTTPQGDDQFDDNLTPTKIITNPNAVGSVTAKTWTSVNRPSYYSFFNDSALSDPLWGNIDQALSDNAKAHPTGQAAFYAAQSVFVPEILAVTVTNTTSPYVTNGQSISQLLQLGNLANHLGPMYQQKFFYLFRILPGHEASLTGDWHTDTSWRAPTLDYIDVKDLMCWRCRPYNSPVLNNPAPPNAIAASSDGRAGFYQMTFDDWTDSYSKYGYSLGAVQSSGDYIDPTDTNMTQNVYSTANINSGVPKGTGAITNGDVSWSPQFAYRSRFYGIYVLGRGLLQGAGPQVRDLGERRIEAVYDALKDEVLWQRAQVSDKRSLGD